MTVWCEHEVTAVVNVDSVRTGVVIISVSNDKLKGKTDVPHFERKIDSRVFFFSIFLRKWISFCSHKW